MMRTVRTYSLDNFQIYHMAALTMTFMPYVVSPVPTYLLTGSLYLGHPSCNVPLPGSQPLVTTNLVLFLSFFFNFLDVTCEENLKIFVSLQCISISIMPSRPIHVVAVLHSSKTLNVSPLWSMVIINTYVHKHIYTFLLLWKFTCKYPC